MSDETSATNTSSAYLALDSIWWTQAVLAKTVGVPGTSSTCDVDRSLFRKKRGQWSEGSDQKGILKKSYALSFPKTHCLAKIFPPHRKGVQTCSGFPKRRNILTHKSDAKVCYINTFQYRRMEWTMKQCWIRSFPQYRKMILQWTWNSNTFSRKIGLYILRWFPRNTRSYWRNSQNACISYSKIQTITLSALW